MGKQEQKTAMENLAKKCVEYTNYRNHYAERHFQAKQDGNQEEMEYCNAGIEHNENRLSVLFDIAGTFGFSAEEIRRYATTNKLW